MHEENYYIIGMKYINLRKVDCKNLTQIFFKLDSYITLKSIIFFNFCSYLILIFLGNLLLLCCVAYMFYYILFVLMYKQENICRHYPNNFA